MNKTCLPIGAVRVTVENVRARLDPETWKTAIYIPSSQTSKIYCGPSTTLLE